MFLGISLINKYITKGWKEVQATYSSTENSDEVAEVLRYLEAVEKVKRSTDEVEVIHLIEEHGLEPEQLLTSQLKSKEVSDTLFCALILCNDGFAILRFSVF